MTYDELIAKHGDYVVATITFADLMYYFHLLDQPLPPEEPTEEELEAIREVFDTQLKPLFLASLVNATVQAASEAFAQNNDDDGPKIILE